jgi:hypothetical protein
VELERVFIGRRMATKRIARAPHQCAGCPRVIQVGEEYYATSVRISQEEIIHEPICEQCWHGPKLERKAKSYRYKEKDSAKSDGIRARLRLETPKEAYFSF